MIVPLIRKASTPVASAFKQAFKYTGVAVELPLSGAPGVGVVDVDIDELDDILVVDLAQELGSNLLA